MSSFIILFISSFLLASLMIGRKFAYAKNKTEQELGNFEFDVPDLKDLQIYFIKVLHSLMHLVLVLSLRIYIKSLNILKKQHRQMLERVRQMRGKNTNLLLSETEQTKEASKFLKVITDYKKKINRIKKKIKEEEGIE